MVSMKALLVLIGPVSAIACTSIPRQHFLLTSEQSTYSPTLRLWTSFASIDGARLVRVDSGFVVVAGQPAANSPTVMRRLFVQAFIAVADSGIQQAAAMGSGREQRGAWHILAMSDSVPLADSLRYGERRRVKDLAFVVPLHKTVIPATAWLGFRVTGDAVPIQAKFEGPRAEERRQVVGGVRVFVCADRSVTGAIDITRAARLRYAYNEAC